MLGDLGIRDMRWLVLLVQSLCLNSCRESSTKAEDLERSLEQQAEEGAAKLDLDTSHVSVCVEMPCIQLKIPSFHVLEVRSALSRRWWSDSSFGELTSAGDAFLVDVDVFHRTSAQTYDLDTSETMSP